MIGKIINFVRRPPYTVRISPHLKKPEIVRAMYIDTLPKKHVDDSDYDPKQCGDLDGDETLGD